MKNIEFLKELASLAGYNLSPKNPKTAPVLKDFDVFIDPKPYLNKSSDTLFTLKQEVETKIKALLTKNQEITKKLEDFMKQQGPNHYTKTMFTNSGQFEAHKVQIYNKRLATLEATRNFIEKELTYALEREMLDSFKRTQNEVDEVSGLYIRQTSSGYELAVVIDEETPKPKPAAKSKESEE